jgi:hypothetical protein
LTRCWFGLLGGRGGVAEPKREYGPVRRVGAHRPFIQRKGTCPASWRSHAPTATRFIHLIGTVGIKQEFGLGPNAIITRREEGRFPDPVLDLGNRLLWLRRDVDTAIGNEAEAKIVKVTDEIERSLAGLPAHQWEKVRQRLRDRL